MDLSALPEGCLSHILSLTSPRDVLRSMVVSKQFSSASDSEALWERFVPSDYLDIISESSSPSPLGVEYRSKRDLFFLLCRSPMLIDDGNMSIVLHKWSGKKCFMVGPRALEIARGDDPYYCIWKPLPESRFLEVAVLRSSCHLNIKAKLHTKVLSPSTTYGVYFVFKMKLNKYDYMSLKAALTEIDESGICKDNRHFVGTETLHIKQCTKQPSSSVRKEIDMDDDWVHVDNDWREEIMEMGDDWMEEVNMGDDWMEVEIGRYKVGIAGANDWKVLEMTLMEGGFHRSKQFLVVHGIKLRPLISE